MTMIYDIGIGRCSAIEGDLIFVRLDALIAKRIAPESPWNRSGTSVLRLRRDLCSERRPPSVGEELFLDSATLTRAAPAEFDLLGNGRFRDVDLRIVLTSMTPIASAPLPSGKLAFPRRGR
jgi:hypothetical protein